jgi:serine protease
MIRFHAVALGALLVYVLPSTARADPYGPPFQVDTFTSPNLSTPSFFAYSGLATGANGDTITFWYSGPNGGSAFMRRYDVAGRPLEAQERDLGPSVRSVAMDGSGNYALLSSGSDASGTGVFVTVYDRRGAVLVSQRRVNDTTAGNQTPGSIVMNAQGDFAVTWESGAPAAARTAYVKRFYANGAPATADIMVQQIAGAQGDFLGGVGVRIDAAGNFVTSWSSGNYLTSPSAIDVWVRRFNASGTPLGAVQRVNTTLSGDQWGGTIAMNEAGAFVIYWKHQLSQMEDGIFAQRYSAAGSPVGGEFRVDLAASGLVEGLDAAMAQDGGFVVSWAKSAVVVARAYASSGSALGDPFTVSSSSTPFATTNRIGMDRAGNFFIGWLQHHFSSDPSNAFKARRYSPAGLAMQPIASGQTLANLAGPTSGWSYFKFSVPTGQATVDASIFGGSGDADLYLRWGALPTLTDWDGRPYLDGNNEGARMLNFPPGDWYIGINGFAAYNGLSLTAASR